MHLQPTVTHTSQLNINHIIFTIHPYLAKLLSSTLCYLFEFSILTTLSSTSFLLQTLIFLFIYERQRFFIGLSASTNLRSFPSVDTPNTPHTPKIWNKVGRHSCRIHNALCYGERKLLCLESIHVYKEQRSQSPTIRTLGQCPSPHLTFKACGIQRSFEPWPYVLQSWATQPPRHPHPPHCLHPPLPSQTLSLLTHATLWLLKHRYALYLNQTHLMLLP